jgi:hypothetical protein
MTREARLKKEAREACRFRGHKMWRNWLYYPDVNGRPRNFSTRCEICHKDVWVDLRPDPNSIEISGEAVALTCTV